ncbi:MAG: prepilin-type N-terminal cleavage/methylation domain-containing protein [Nitrosomonas sp.]|nr:prepilin-type N-terminal cleavage/methylation domain-containing protein [Nitrosomonas sp.]
MSARAEKLNAASHCWVRGQQGGFSLIELMISITLGLLIMTGVLALYLDLTKSNADRQE